jgi:hypothetical protein
LAKVTGGVAQLLSVRQIPMRIHLISLFALMLVFGCAHQSAILSPARYWPTQAQLNQFRDRALTAVHPDEYDDSRPVQYWMQEGNPPRLIVSVPTKSAHSLSFSEVIFDLNSGQILEKWGVLIH